MANGSMNLSVNKAVNAVEPPWRVYRVLGRPVFAVPKSPRQLRAAGLARFQPYSAKRAAYRRLMRLAVGARLDSLLSRSTDNPVRDIPDFDMSGWLAHAREVLSQDVLHPVLVWPPQVDRGRIYAHLLDTAARSVGFAKISFDENNDRCLRTERDTLTDLTARGLRECRVPSVKASGQWQGREYLILEPVPVEAEPLPLSHDAYPRKCVEEFAGASREIPAGQLETLSWWPRFTGRPPKVGTLRAFTDDLCAAADRAGLRIRRVHGDFARPNLLTDGTDLWVLDWEESCPDGPALLDELMFDMHVNFQWSDSDPQGSVKRFNEQYLSDGGAEVSDARRADVLAAVAFMHGVGHNSATGLVSHWGNPRGR